MVRPRLSSQSADNDEYSGNRQNREDVTDKLKPVLYCSKPFGLLEMFQVQSRENHLKSGRLVIVCHCRGHIAARLNPAPAGKFADLVVAGDAECVLPGILEHLEQGRGESRENLLSALSRLEGTDPAVPCYRNSGEPVAQRIFDPPSSFKRMVLVETGRAGQVAVRVFNVTGQARGSLPARTLPAGNHTLTMEKQSLTSGIYIYTIALDGQTGKQGQFVVW